MPKTIWNAGAQPLVPSRYRSIYTSLLPVIDLGVLTFGLSALLLGSKIIADFTIPIFLPVWGLLIVVGAVLALVGLIFLKPKVELAGRISVIAGLTVYLGLTILYIVGGSVTSALTLILVAIRIYASGWRFFDLLGEMAEKEAKKAVDTGSVPSGGKHSE